MCNNEFTATDACTGCGRKYTYDPSGKVIRIRHPGLQSQTVSFSGQREAFTLTQNTQHCADFGLDSAENL